MNIEELNQIVKIKVPPHLILFCGEEQYLRDFYMNALADIVVPDREDIANRVTVVSPCTWKDIKTECETLPFFADKKVVLVRDSGLFKAGKSSDDDAFKFISELEDCIYLFISETDMDKRSKVYKYIQKNGDVSELDGLKPEELGRWIARQLKIRGFNITKEAVAVMTDLCSTSMTAILSEIDKLCNYCKGSEAITADDIRMVCTPSVKSIVFNLTDALANGQGGEAYRILNEQRLRNEADYKLFSMMMTHISKMYRIKSLMAERVPESEALKLTGIHPYAFKKMASQAKGFSEKKLKELYVYCVESDESVKTGKMSLESLMDILIAKAGDRK